MPAPSPVSPLALPLPALPMVAGVRVATAQAGIRYHGRTDVLLVALDEGTNVAGVFTRNLCPGAPVSYCREILPGGVARGLVVNAGNANVFTGAAGVRAVEETAHAAAATLGTTANAIFL
ncbi:MAG: bifunctional ornithine acetyltransferase/N-acetylglutamate synthase, partial [Acidocella sp.]|nr:bifunctional ornithine acetyltransferase/N-acetylglutamate synthase [Acidocella sp.]